jgi:dinuclear metal center YbgI/SA1388 family protein
MATVGDLANWLDQFAPRSLAESWDNTGLLLGDRAAPADRVMTCLTVTPDSASEAIAEQAQLIVSHHPILFRAVQRLTADDPQGRMLLDLARAGVAVYSAHTAFDSAAGGINAEIARRLELQQVAPLRPATSPPRAKLVTFVPVPDLDRVSQALFAAGAGQIGEYRECSFRVSGTGTFRGSEASHPTIGQSGRHEQVAEWRLEVVCPQSRVPDIVAALRAAHSYEEPAYDIYPLQAEATASGAGRYGVRSAAIALREFAARVRQALGGRSVEVVGIPDRMVTRVAIACGAGAEFLADARRLDCEVLITGEARFHAMLEAEALGVALVLAGHYATERLGIEMLATRLSGQFPALRVWPSQREHDPAWCA